MAVSKGVHINSAWERGIHTYAERRHAFLQTIWDFYELVNLTGLRTCLD
jgi:hypothetical protein